MNENDRGVDLEDKTNCFVANILSSLPTPARHNVTKQEIFLRKIKTMPSLEPCLSSRLTRIIRDLQNPSSNIFHTIPLACFLKASTHVLRHTDQGRCERQDDRHNHPLKKTNGNPTPTAGRLQYDTIRYPTLFYSTILSYISISHTLLNPPPPPQNEDFSQDAQGKQNPD